MKVDEEFRLAKLKRDTATLTRILADNFYETNQNGNSRNKAQMIELFRDFTIGSLTTDAFEARITGDTAVVTGSQTEDSDRMLFTRIYAKAPAGWQLLASMQFHNPNAAIGQFGQQGANDPHSVQEQVMRVDEDFRLAKIKRDTATLTRVLADNFYETTQNGNSRNKAQMIELFRDFTIGSLTTDAFEVRITGASAVVTGSQTEDADRMLFMRAYVKTPAGWQLLASMQFRDPNAPPVRSLNPGLL